MDSRIFSCLADHRPDTHPDTNSDSGDNADHRPDTNPDTNSDYGDNADHRHEKIQNISASTFFITKFPHKIIMFRYKNL